MPWFKVWDGLKNKTCRYLLHRYLGQFLEEKLNVEQLNVELYNGKASVRNVSLNIDSLNELFEGQGWCFEVTRGTIGLITVTVPWNALMTSNSTIEIFDLYICLRPIQRQNNGTSMLESMWSSVSSSMQLAQECMNHTDDACNPDQLEQNESIDGLEKFAETIDNVLNRIRAKCTNVIFKLEYMPKECLHGIAVLIKINSLLYQNNVDCQNNMENETDMQNKIFQKENQDFSNANVNILATYANHNIILNDVSVFTEEFKVSNSYVDCSMSNLWKFSIKKNLDEKTSNIGNKNTIMNENKNTSSALPILFVQGQQRILLKIKQSETIEGPKVIFDIELGDINLIVSPRQIHLLSHFYEQFYGNKNTEDILRNDEISSALESSKEFYGQEEYNISSSMTGGIVTQNMWGEISHNKELKSTESFKSHSEKKCENPCLISINSSMCSSNTATSSMKFKRTIPNVDICSNISKFNVKIAKTLVLIIQEEILVEQNIKIFSKPLSDESERNLLDIAEEFFFACQQNSEKYISKNISISTKNHISLLMSPITVDGVQQRIKNVIHLDMCITAATLDIQEILDKIPTPLIYFDKDLYGSKGLISRPEVTVILKSTTPLNVKNSFTCPIPGNTEFKISLSECLMELDISIYDRLSAIFGYTSFKKYHQLSGETNSSVNLTESQSNTNIEVISEKFDIKLRFPIVDARPIHDPDRKPWWKQNIRADYILFSMKDISVSLMVNTLKIKASAIDAFYCEAPMIKTHLLKVTSTCDTTSLMEPKLQYPIIMIEKPNVVTMQQCENCNLECSNMDCCCVPFSTKRVCRQSGTIISNNEIPEQPEIFILPGETIEIRKFCDTTFKSSKLKVKMDLPRVILELESKQLYETIYNRLNADLFMWEPCAPTLQNRMENPLSKEINNSLFNSSFELDTATYYSFTYSDDNKILENFEPDKFSTLYQKNSSESFDYNFCNSIKKRVSKDIQKNESVNKSPSLKKPSLCSFEITIKEGSLAFVVPAQVEDTILGLELGKFIIRLNNISFFFVSGYKSDKNLEYLCLSVQNFEIFHCGLIPEGFSTSLNMNLDMPPYMKSTFYKTPSSLTKGKGEGCVEREILSVVVEINKMPDQRIKRLKITTGLQKTTLRHNPAPPTQTWLCQLLDFLEIKDYPVYGYLPYEIISEIQLHIWDCAIDYRPKYFPFRSVIEIGSFDVSSNVISSELGCTLRFVTEDCIFSIAQNDINIIYPDFEITTIPSSDLVPVLEIGLLDISLRISDKSTERCPKLDLRCIIQDVHLRTCSDSGKALAQLISYVANEGESFTSAGSSATIYSSHNFENETNNQQEHVNKLMAEAVLEPNTEMDKTHAISNQNELESRIGIFHFPDEGHPSSSILLGNQEEYESIISSSNNSHSFNERNDLVSSGENKKPICMGKNVTFKTLPQIKEDLGDISAISEENSANKYEEYCFIADEENSFMTNFGIRNLNVSEDPLRIVDNHFLVPICKPDVLKSPENSPMVEQRFTLCEMVFTWHLYGGNDFPFSDSSANQHETKSACSLRKGGNSNMSEAYRYGVSYSNNNDCLIFAKKPKEKQTWKTIGGINRHQEVLVEIHLSKVRCTHEVYSEFSTRASRQVLIVNELEIRDRLQSSEINKFLYHQKLNKFSGSNTQNMILIKALHVRLTPEIHSPQECSLKISLLPLRLHIDQDTLLFLVDFFTNLNDNCKNESLQSDVEFKSNSTLPFFANNDPVMKVDTKTKIEKDFNAHQLVSENWNLLMKDKNKQLLMSAGSSQIYFKEVIFSPEARIRFDYHGRRIELSRGPLTGLLMGLGQLNCSEIKLKKIVYKRGILGFDKLLTYLCKEWLKDIKRNQLPNILSGVGPTYAFIQLFQGIYDLFKLPIEQFQKDRRIIKGLQLGARSFTARTALAALEITSRIIQLLQFTAETAFDMVSTGPTIKVQGGSCGKRKRHHRPKDIREGVTNALNIVKEGFNDSAHKFIENAISEHDQKGYSGAVGAVMRQIPQLVVCPAVLATQATNNILGGAKNSLVPEAKWEARDKWKDDNDD